MKLFENICLGVVTASVAFLMIEGGLFFRMQGQKISPVLASANEAIQSANRVLKQTARLENTVFDTAASYSQQLAKQSADWQKAQLQVYKTITDAKEILVRTDRSLNDVLVPRMAAALDASTELQRGATAGIAATTVKIDGAIDELVPGTREMIDNGIRATAAAAADMSDPAIHETLTHVDGTAGNLDATSGDIRAFVHRETTPVRGTWNTIKAFLRDFAGPAAQVGTAVK